jgi:hypothetical protein
MTIFPVNTNRGDIRITVQMGSPFLICQTLDFNRMDNQEKQAELETQDTGRMNICIFIVYEIENTIVCMTMLYSSILQTTYFVFRFRPANTFC